MKLNSFQLKWIAIITMVIDHVGVVFFPQHLIFRYIGRISFPIFAFLLVEGFYHSKDIGKYLLRLGAFAIVSEIPFDLALRGALFEITRQNVFFTLAIGLGLLWMLNTPGDLWMKIIYVLLAMWLANFLHTDYGYRGILLILIFYVFRERKQEKVILGALWNLIRNRKVQGYGMLAMIPISLYNGERGPKMKYFFYVFYPVHLLVISLFRYYM